MEKQNALKSLGYSHISLPATVAISASSRREVRKKGGIKFPCEQVIRKTKWNWAGLHGTETRSVSYRYNDGTTLHVAYVTDPMKLILKLTQHSKEIMIGGDCGNGITKLGFTYTDQQCKHSFQPLIVYEGKDNYHDLLTLSGKSHSISR